LARPQGWIGALPQGQLCSRSLGVARILQHPLGPPCGWCPVCSSVLAVV